MAVTGHVWTRIPFTCAVNVRKSPSWKTLAKRKFLRGANDIDSRRWSAVVSNKRSHFFWAHLPLSRNLRPAWEGHMACVSRMSRGQRSPNLLQHPSRGEWHLPRPSCKECGTSTLFRAPAFLMSTIKPISLLRRMCKDRCFLCGGYLVIIK